MPADSELIQRAISGDAQAFGELYEENLKPIYRYVFYRVGNADEAEDLTEQTFLKAWEAMGRFREQGVPFSAWLYRLAHNLVIDYHRTRHNPAPLDDAIDSEDRGPGPEEVASEHLEIEALKKAVARLTPEQQQVVLLRFVEGLGHSDVAAIMGKNEGAVRGLQHRALQALHAILIEHGGQ
jgi:RNA polymerase sigma-70 factor, ECF subfamily